MISRPNPIGANPSARRTGIQTLIVYAVLGISACSSAPKQAPLPASRDTSATVSSASELSSARAPEKILDDVALDDLVRALVQYRDPINTTLQTGLDTARENNTGLLAVLSERGYGLQLVDADQGSNYLSYTTEEIETSDSPTTRHSLQVGQLLLSRDYTTTDTSTLPIGPLSVAGSRRTISLDDSRFGEDITSDQLISSVTLSTGDEIDPDETPRISLLQLPLNATNKNSAIVTNTSGLEVSNIYSGGNNFGSVLDGYSRVETANVLFANDAMRLGDTGRLKIEVFLERFEEESDLIRVVGCSNGSTNIDIGNEGLALGRAERVTQALLARGVTREHILDEGCWGPQPIGQRFPSRGVVLELYRTS